MEGDVLVWVGGEAGAAPPTGIPPPQRDPRSYTPKHLAEKILTTRSALEGERKQVTVLFADLKGSMDLSESIDPEKWHKVMDRFFAILTDGVHRFEGTVNQYTAMESWRCLAPPSRTKIILHVADSLDAVAKRFGMEPAALDGALAKAREDLYSARRKRVPPFQDTKIITSWNGLMISAYARAALVLGDPDYAARAVKGADFVLSRMREGGRLRRSHFQGRAEGMGFLDDYAFLEQAMLDLYEATFEPRWLREAAELQAILDGHFRDAEHGGYFLTPDDGEAMLTREKPSYDVAEPSGNSVALYNLARPAELTSDDRYRQRADETLAAFGAALEGTPTALPKMLSAIDFRLDAPKEIVLVKPDARASEEEMLARLRRTFLPNRVLTVATEGRDLTEEKKLVPLLEGRKAIGGKVTAYVCEAQVCKLPTTDPEVFAKQIAARGSAAR